METVKAASLSNKVSSFLHLIPGTTTVRLNFPTVQILVHGLPTDRSLPDIAQELTTFNTGQELSRPPRWLTPDNHCASKRISTVVFTPPVQGHGTLLHALASLPSQQHSRLNTIFASTATPYVTAAISTAITHYAAPTHLAAAGVPVPSPLGTTLVPPLHATQRVAPAHTPRLSVSHAPALTKHTLPSAPTVLPLSPVRRVERMMRCTSTRGLPTPLLLTSRGSHSYFVACKGGLVHSQACYALLDGGGPTSESP